MDRSLLGIGSVGAIASGLILTLRDKTKRPAPEVMNLAVDMNRDIIEHLRGRSAPATLAETAYAIKAFTVHRAFAMLRAHVRRSIPRYLWSAPRMPGIDEQPYYR